MKYYFAYGSNMWKAKMDMRCPSSQIIGLAILKGYKWIITTRGYASVVKSGEDEVEGILYSISESDESSLDRNEGVSCGSYEKVNLKTTCNGIEADALVYIDPIKDEGKPKEEYNKRMNNALRDAGLSQGYITKYIRKFIPEKIGE